MKFGVREICDVVLKAKSDVEIGSHTFKKGEPVIYFDTAKTSSLESAATTVYAQGGKGNPRLIAWEGEKTLTFTLEDALISPMGLAILSGAGLTEASSTAINVHTTAVATATEADKVVISGTPVALTVADIYVMKLDDNGEAKGAPIKATAISTESGNTTITATGLAANDKVMVDFYTAKTGTYEINITADKFAGYYYLEASTLWRRELDGKDLPAEIIIPKVKIQSNFTFTMASSGDPSTFTFTMDAFPDYTKFNTTEKVLCSMQVVDPTFTA